MDRCWFGLCYRVLEASKKGLPLGRHAPALNVGLGNGYFSSGKVKHWYRVFLQRVPGSQSASMGRLLGHHAPALSGWLENDYFVSGKVHHWYIVFFSKNRVLGSQSASTGPLLGHLNQLLASSYKMVISLQQSWTAHFIFWIGSWRRPRGGLKVRLRDPLLGRHERRVWKWLFLFRKGEPLI